MKKKQFKCYLLLGTIVMLVLATLCSATFIQTNLRRTAEKESFESAFNVAIDFIIPAPSFSQVEELEQNSAYGIDAVTPYFETTTAVALNGKNANGTALIFPDAHKMQYTPYCCERIVSGSTQYTGGTAIIDQKYAEQNGCSIGDVATIVIANHEYNFQVVSISEANISYSGTIALILTDSDIGQLQNDGIRYSAAYVYASDFVACKNYLTSEYLPLGRLKDRAEFSNDDTYNQHVQNFEDADWSKEVTNCRANYEALKVKYDDVNSSVITNIAIMSAIIVIVVVVFNSVLLKHDSMKKFMRLFLVKKSGTKDNIKSFYKNGICANAAVFCIAMIGLYSYSATAAKLSLFNFQIINCVVPVLACVIISFIMSAICSTYIEKHYKIKKKKDSAEIDVEVV